MIGFLFSIEIIYLIWRDSLRENLGMYKRVKTKEIERSKNREFHNPIEILVC